MAKITPQVKAVHVGTPETVVIGMTREAAINTLKKAGFIARIMGDDDKLLLGTCDFRMDRVSLYIKNGIVYQANRG